MIIPRILSHVDPSLQMSESMFTGPGEVLLAPETWGDIVPIHLDGQTAWSVGRDAVLACTTNVMRDTKSQGFGKALCKLCPHHHFLQIVALTLAAHSLWRGPLRASCPRRGRDVGTEFGCDHVTHVAARRAVDW